MKHTGYPEPSRVAPESAPGATLIRDQVTYIESQVERLEEIIKELTQRLEVVLISTAEVATQSQPPLPKGDVGKVPLADRLSNLNGQINNICNQTEILLGSIRL